MNIEPTARPKKSDLRIAWEEQVYLNLKDFFGINPHDPRLSRFEVILDEEWEYGDVMSVSLGIGAAFYAELTTAEVRSGEETLLWMALRHVLTLALANKFITYERYKILWDFLQTTAYDAALSYPDKVD